MFAAGLALPFFLLALFPQYLKKMPRSGGWLARVKVVMGFVDHCRELQISGRHRPGDAMERGHARTIPCNLGGSVRHGRAVSARIPAARRRQSRREDRVWDDLLTGMAFLAFALSLIPGMFGAHLGEVGDYRAATHSGTGALGGASGEPALVWMKNDLAGALDRARKEKKLVLVNFTGYACTNCHWMKANMFTRPEIAA